MKSSVRALKQTKARTFWQSESLNCQALCHKYAADAESISRIWQINRRKVHKELLNTKIRKSLSHKVLRGGRAYWGNITQYFPCRYTLSLIIGYCQKQDTELDGPLV